MTKYIALDFDGVICNSINECMLVSFCSFFDINITNDSFSNISNDQKNKFSRYRYLVGPAFEYNSLWEAIENSKSNDSIISYFTGINPSKEIAVKNQKKFYKNRTDFKIKDFTNWSRLNPFYGEIHKALIAKKDLRNIFIVTSKDYQSVVELLKYNKIPINKKQIYSYEKSLDKKILFEELLDEHKIDKNDIIFIDDKLSHLENVTTFGIKSFLALWGYISPSCEIRAKKKK
tara:strand:- start:8 stop:703 length:696 start_codon:yes stop_codon:yes gene_type:complete